jgi:hypothetical protein
MTHPQFAGHKFAYLKKEYTDGTKVVFFSLSLSLCCFWFVLQGLAVLMKSDPSSFVTAERYKGFFFFLFSCSFSLLAETCFLEITELD